MNTPDGSITRLLPSLRTRDERAIRELWQRYSGRVERLARPLIHGLAPGAGDEQDVAQSAFLALCESVSTPKAVDLRNRNELWRLLAAISRRKAIDRVRRELRERRGGASKPVHTELQRLPGSSAAPDEIVELKDTLCRLFAVLEENSDPRLRLVALLRLQEVESAEIAERLNCTMRTVQRKLLILQRVWQEEIE